MSCDLVRSGRLATMSAMLGVAGLALAGDHSTYPAQRSTTAAGGFEMSWSSVDGGGGSSSGGEFVLRGTIGQPDAGVMTGRGFAFSGGFWQPAAAESPPCPTDFDLDGDTDAADLATVLGNWGPYGACPPHVLPDLDQDCDVDAADLADVLGHWGTCGS